MLRHGRQIVRGQSENHSNGMQLREDQQAGGIGCVHNVADINLTKTHSPADWRSNARIKEIQFYVVDLRLIGAHSALKLTNQRLLRIELLFGDDSAVLK